MNTELSAALTRELGGGFTVSLIRAPLNPGEVTMVLYLNPLRIPEKNLKDFPEVCENQIRDAILSTSIVQNLLALKEKQIAALQEEIQSLMDYRTYYMMTQNMPNGVKS